MGNTANQYTSGLTLGAPPKAAVNRSPIPLKERVTVRGERKLFTADPKLPELLSWLRRCPSNSRELRAGKYPPRVQDG